MTTYTLPTEANAFYDFTITLEDLEWLITIRWNQTGAFWKMDLEGLSTPEIVFRGIKLVGGVDLFKPYAILELGHLYVVDLEGENQDPDFDGFGTRFALLYADKAEGPLS